MDLTEMGPQIDHGFNLNITQMIAEDVNPPVETIVEMAITNVTIPPFRKPLVCFETSRWKCKKETGFEHANKGITKAVNTELTPPELYLFMFRWRLNYDHV
jgi:hypothetical protein